MRLLLSAISIVLFVSCNAPTSPFSYWAGQKENFKYRNKIEFRSDSALQSDLPHLKKITHPLFEKINAKDVFLYSWQERDVTKNEFTVIKDNGEYGLSTYYFVLDKKDSLVSFEEIAGKENEGNYWFEKSANFSGKDTIFTFRSLAQGYDIETQKEFAPYPGPRTYIVFMQNGEMQGYVEAVIRQ